MSKDTPSRRASRARATPPPPADSVELRWGKDILTILDIPWCHAIEVEGCQPAPDDINELWGRYSRYDAQLARDGLGLPLEEIEQLPRGVARLAQPPIAGQCLKVFLGLDLPTAMLCGDSYGQPLRFIAIRAQLEVWRGAGSALFAEFLFDGLQLYANGHIGRPVRSIRTTPYSEIKRRSIANRWHNVDFHMGAQSFDDDLRVSRRLYVQDGNLCNEIGVVLRRIST